MIDLVVFASFRLTDVSPQVGNWSERGQKKVRIRSGTGQEQVRNRPGTGQQQVRNRPGTGQEQVTIEVKQVRNRSQ